MKKNVFHFLIIFILASIILNAQKSIAYATDAVNMCLYMIVPTLFPFFICTGLLIHSGFCQRLAYLFRFCMMPLFHVNPSGSSAFVLGILSGYPLGAVTAGELYQNGYLSKTEAQRLLAFCNNSGPLFILGSIGTAMYSKLQYGVILYVIHILSAITVGIIFGFYKRDTCTSYENISSEPQKNIGEIFSISLQNAVSTILTVCGAIIFFSIISRLFLDILPISGVCESLVAGICEFVTGTKMISSLNINIAQKLIMSAFVIGFAGLSVHVQVLAVISKYHLSLAPYIIGKFLHGLTAAAYTALYLHFFPITSSVSVFAATSVSCGFAASSAYVITAVATIALLSLAFYVLSFNLTDTNQCPK